MFALVAMFVIIVAIEFRNYFVEFLSHNDKLYHTSPIIQTT